jgi:hypothetical protein
MGIVWIIRYVVAAKNLAIQVLFSRKGVRFKTMNFLQHCWSLALLIYIIMGPIPCSLVLALPSSYRLENLTITRIPLVIFTSWSTLQICIGLLAGTVGQFSLNLIILWESILFVFGIAILYLHKSTIFSDAKKYLDQHKKLSKL